MPNPGWLGDWDQVRDTLDRIGADRDENGAYLVRGVGSFMGAGVEYLITTEAMVRVGGEWRELYPELPENVCKGIMVF